MTPVAETEETISHTKQESFAVADSSQKTKLDSNLVPNLELGLTMT